MDYYTTGNNVREAISLCVMQQSPHLALSAMSYCVANMCMYKRIPFTCLFLYFFFFYLIRENKKVEHTGNVFLWSSI